MIRYVAFQVAEVFPEDDPLSEWLITLALAMNDLALVHVRLDEDQDEPDRAFYWHRLALSHFTEAALFLHDTVHDTVHETAAVPEVKAFVESLSEEARAKCDACLAIFCECRNKLFNVRNKTMFHYPTLRPAHPQADRPIREALAAMRDDRGVIRSARICDARFLFADDVAATIFARAVGGLDALPSFEAQVAEGTTAFIRFANLAIDEHLVRAQERGVVIDEVEPADPGDLWRGWKVRWSE